MNRDAFVNLMLTHNDAYIHYNSKVSKKMKYYVGTLDFVNTDYVRELYVDKYKTVPPTAKQIREGKGSNVVVFCWDLNDFKTIDVDSVSSIEGLADTLKNTREA